jgi:hypothetical protein
MSRAVLAVAALLLVVSLVAPLGERADLSAAITLPGTASAKSQEGIFRCGAIYLKLNHEVVYSIISTNLIYPVLKCDIAIWDTTLGYTDGLGNVTFRIPVYIYDNTDTYDAEVKLTVAAENRTTGQHIGEDFYWGSTSDEDDIFFYWDFATDKLDGTSGRNRYHVSAEATVTVYRFLKQPSEWYDFDWSNKVHVQSGAHPPWQQEVEITTPADSSQYVIGSHTKNVIGYVQAGDDPPPGGGTATMTIVTNAASRDQESSFTTGANGGFWEPLYIGEPTAEGEVNIHIYDDARSEEYLADPDGGEITIFATRSAGWTTFGLFAVPGHHVAAGGSTDYLVSIPSYDGYEADVTLDVKDLPPGVLYSFDTNPVHVPPDTTRGVMLTLEATGLTPPGFHEITITASDDTLTREFVCPLMVEDLIPPDPVMDMEVIALDDTSATLCWTAPGASADSGWAHVYDIRYSTIFPDVDTAGWWAAADTVADEPMVGPPGWRDTCTVENLALPDSIYFFAIKTADGALIWSGISNIAEIPDAGVERPDAAGPPLEFTLSRTYPNPFMSATEIKYAIPRECHVSLEVYDIRGRKVVGLVDEEQGAGYKCVKWNAASSSPGIYFCRFRAGNFTGVEKMVILK